MIVFSDRFPQPHHQQQQDPGQDGSSQPDPPAASGLEPTPLHLRLAAARDFGGLRADPPPATVALPSTASDVTRAIRAALSHQTLTLSARGCGHSVHGQANAPHGIVLDMSSMRGSMAVIPRVANTDPEQAGSTGSSYFCVDVKGGEVWEDVLRFCLQFGMAPRSWTDFLSLSVGGTLSNGGVSGQSFRYGPQVVNVEEMEVVTGSGEVVRCSERENGELFFGVLGGLGQFGIITRARILLQKAPDMVRWIRVVYADFDDFSRDQELLVTRASSESFDYIEGFVFTNSDHPVNGCHSVPLLPHQTFDLNLIPANAGPVLYCLEIALHFANRDDAKTIEKRVSQMLEPLKFRRGLKFSCDLTYYDFLQRVKSNEEAAKANGTWDAPHPWLNLFISSKNIQEFDSKVFNKILKNGIGGSILVYPLIKSKWDPRMSVVVPDNEIFYLVALLRFNKPYPEGPSLQSLLAQNQEIIDCCTSNNFDFKVYIPHCNSQDQWKAHFGNQWSRFVERKAAFDPMAVLAPGQRIFPRVQSSQ
ncbi:cytokinin dehydrogenase 7 [Amborella trichopoda]|uniref:cytokinin dehydrogenase n=1 Tax=Amborella trichopoda TaxID=13333 RepID=W1PTT2_AMBTC|nr:cytokinin dehydrogenase 7 [Amborella trichopoda]ERN11229.1 hypothetical protein AMTR_s00024p00226830 [Amborella trichopoda]|eukprot:XP_006849648.1 cytokinin dehydrogenase 7 [Amborella trichopoda]